MTRTRSDYRRPRVLDDADWLEQKHIRERTPIGKIAGELGCDVGTVRRALDRAGIELVRSKDLVPPSADDPLIAEFVQWRERRRHSERTISQSRSVLGRVLAEYNAYAVTGRQLDDWLHGLGVGDATLTTYRTQLGAFFGFLQTTGRRVDDPSKLVSAPAFRRGLPRPIEASDFAVVFAEADILMRCWLALGYFQGMRRTEIALLERHQVSESQIRPVGKGDKERVIPTHPRTWETLNEYGLADEGLLWEVDPTWLGRLMGRHMRRCGVDATPHQLRHAFATSVYASTKDLLLTGKLLGHESILTTAIYARVTVDDAATAAVRAIGAA